MPLQCTEFAFPLPLFQMRPHNINFFAFGKVALLWIWPLYLHVNQKSDDDDDEY